MASVSKHGSSRGLPCRSSVPSKVQSSLWDLTVLKTSKVLTASTVVLRQWVSVRFRKAVGSLGNTTSPQTHHVDRRLGLHLFKSVTTPPFATRTFSRSNISIKPLDTLCSIPNVLNPGRAISALHTRCLFGGLKRSNSPIYPQGSSFSFEHTLPNNTCRRRSSS